MRMWCGVDVEHNPGNGKMTLFVESCSPDIDRILDILAKSDYKIECVYFGAGEVDIRNWEFLENIYKLSEAFIVGLESSVSLPKYIVDKFNFVIIRLPILCVSDNIYVKYRAKHSVGIASVSKFATNSLADLTNGQYSNDIEVYNDGD